jgi:hypothetical protein
MLTSKGIILLSGEGVREGAREKRDRERERERVES